MATAENTTDVHLLKHTKISVHVDEALPDIIVVTYEFGVKIFKGVLLDSTKKNLPCGVQTLNPALNVPKANSEEDPLYAVNQRFNYTEPGATKKRTHLSKYKNNKMTVRLRPRQVLCSKCKGICNENSENVTRKRKSTESVPNPHPKRSANAPVTRSVQRNIGGYVKPTSTTQIKRTKMDKVKKSNGNVSEDTNSNVEEDQSFVHSQEHSEQPSTTTSLESVRNFGKTTKHKQMLRKKRNLGSAEEPVEEIRSEPDTKNKETPSTTFITQNCNVQNEQPLTTTCTNTRTIKISYGPQGEGTVLKIPAQIENLVSDHDSEENLDEQKLLKMKDENKDKAARRAMKKAKKEAKKKVLLNHSPTYSIGASSPRYTVGSASPRHGLGNVSPRYMVNSTCDINAPRRRKHKVKHKKRHKEVRKHREEDVETTHDDPPVEQVITQKLSINLKRLNNTYTSCSSSVENEDSGSEDISDQVPDFPPVNSPIVLHLNVQSVSGVNGCKLLVGDVIWGKIHGFPWWPGKILAITNGDNKCAQAHVSWYGSSTSSLIKCDQLSPYLENFKVRYNKKKKGPYKEAIKQATNDARENAENRVREQQQQSVVGGSPARTAFINVVPPALASPREIDVVS
nr:PWWP domain-containing protein 2A-like [Onthophagus taurus]